MLMRRHEESRPICEEALTLARAVDALGAEIRALAVLGVDLAYMGHGEEGLACIREALRRADTSEHADELAFVYVVLSGVLTMLARPRESARLAAAGAEAVRRYGMENGTIVTNRVEALVAAGDWDEADRVSAAALRSTTANRPHQRLMWRAALEIGRGDFRDARMHLEAALATVREDVRDSLWYDPIVIELALWERRWTDADAAMREALSRVRARDAALFRVQLCAQGLRARAELAALARGRDDTHALDGHLGRAQRLVTAARRAATEAAAVTPNARGWRALAEAEYVRAGGDARPEAWSEAAAAWEQLERPPLAAYCRWRQAEALVAERAVCADAAVAFREAHAVAVRLGAQPLLRELELLEEQSQFDLSALDAGSPGSSSG
jgi:tetratricopeptide (TPR) repeat protein